MLRFTIILLIFLNSFPVLSQTVYVTETGHRYHQKDCIFLKESQNTIKLTDANELGYLACKRCYPNHKKKSSFKIEKNSVTPYLSFPYVLILIILTGGSITFWYLIWRQKSTNNDTVFLPEENKLLEILKKNEQGLDTFGLNSILEIEHKSQDSQRTTRTKFLKTLIQKLNTQHNIPDVIIRKQSKEDKRIIFYTLNPKLVGKLKSN